LKIQSDHSSPAGWNCKRLLSSYAERAEGVILAELSHPAPLGEKQVASAFYRFEERIERLFNSDASVHPKDEPVALLSGDRKTKRLEREWRLPGRGRTVGVLLVPGQEFAPEPGFGEPLPDSGDAA